MLRITMMSVVAMVCGVALLAAACGGSSGATNTDTANEPAAEEATSVPSTREESPLAELLGIPLTDDDSMEEFFGQLQRDAELKISECMLAQGFQYQAMDFSQIQGLDVNIDTESREYAEEYGFGVASNPFEETFEAFQDFEDPNQEYLATLGEGEVEAYQTALNGELPDFDASEELDFFEPGGCQGEAYDEVFAFGLVFDQFADEFDEIEAQYEADPRIVAASAGWGTCMGESGYSFGNVEGAESDIQRRYDTIVNTPDAYEEEEDILSEEEFEGGGTEEIFVFGPRTLKPEFQARVDELAVEERAIATASWDCNSPLREIENEVRVEYEQRFVDQNGAAISEALNN